MASKAHSAFDFAQTPTAQIPAAKTNDKFPSIADIAESLSLLNLPDKFNGNTAPKVPNADNYFALSSSSNNNNCSSLFKFSKYGEDPFAGDKVVSAPFAPSAYQKTTSRGGDVDAGPCLQLFSTDFINYLNQIA